MANVITHHHLGFHAGPINHSPSPLGFGFGLSSPMSSWTPSTVHSPQSQWPTPSPAFAAQSPQLRSAKRRHEPEDDHESGNKHARDDAMERSPTPDRPKRAAPKRARITAAVPNSAKPHDGLKNTNHSSDSCADVDVGVLLASLPKESLLPLLNSLISTQPALKTSILSLIPRPSLDTAIQAITNASRKLLDAFPYSNNSMSFSLAQSSTPFSSAGFSNPASSGFESNTGFGFGRLAQAMPFGQTQHAAGGMREEYVISRLRPHIVEFVSVCYSYLPYFSYTTSLPQQHSHAQSHASALQSQHKVKSHPSETFLFLQALVSQILAQPPLTRASLVPQLLPRVVEEWKAWIDRVDEVVNRQGGMFGQETVRGWEKALDEFAEAKGDGLEVMKEIRDRWVSKVGWLVGRQPMEEEL
ncbi:Tethering factor for nuclear proteasome STS1 [Abortiporus biennis]